MRVVQHTQPKTFHEIYYFFKFTKKNYIYISIIAQQRTASIHNVQMLNFTMAQHVL